MAKIKHLPRRSQVKPGDTWDLSSLFPNDAAWETAFQAWEAEIPGYEKFRGKLGTDAKTLAPACGSTPISSAGEQLGTYAFLKTAEDTADSTYQRMIGRYRNVASRTAQASSYIRPEIMAIPAKTMDALLDAKPLADFRWSLVQLLRYKPHTLSKREEMLLAMQSEMADASNQAFRQLTDADLKWGMIRNERGEQVELSNSSFSSFLQSPVRGVRKRAFQQYYAQFTAHQNTLAATLSGSIQRDVYYARARNYKSALAASLFHDNVPVAVVDNLIESVHAHLPSLYRYYDLPGEKCSSRNSPLRYLRADSQRTENATHLEPGGQAGPVGDRAPGQRVLRRSRSRTQRPLGRPVSEPGQAKRRLQLGLVCGRSLHPDELPTRRSGPRVHAGPRGRPFDAQPLLGQASAVSLLQLHDFRGRSGQHVQRTIARAPHDAPRRQRPAAAFLINREIDSIRGTILRKPCSPNSSARRTPWSSRASR